MWLFCVDKQRGQAFDVKYINKVARDIAPFWNDVGIQLGVNHLNNIQNIHNPTEYKFKEMLQEWLRKQKCSKHDVFTKFYEALKEIRLIKAAEEFSEKALGDIN